MNYIGVAIITISTMLYIFVKPEVKIDSSVRSEKSENNQPSNPKTSFIDELNPILKRKIGILFAILSGIFYGIMVGDEN